MKSPNLTLTMPQAVLADEYAKTDELTAKLNAALTTNDELTAKLKAADNLNLTLTLTLKAAEFITLS